MTNFINANINAGKFFIRKSTFTPVEGKSVPPYYIEVFSPEGVSQGTTGVWVNEGKQGKFFSGDLSKVTRSADKTPFILGVNSKTSPKPVTTDPHEGKDIDITPKAPF